MSRHNRSLIDQTALRLFSRRGISEVSMRDLAEAMGVQQSTLYRHMRSKDELVERIFSEAYQDLARRLDAAMAPHAAIDARLQAVVEAACSAYDDEPDLVRFLLMRQHEVLPRLRPDIVTPIAVLERFCREAIAQGCLDAGLTAAEASALMTGIILQPLTFIHYGTLDAPARGHVPMLMRALRGALYPR